MKRDLFKVRHDREIEDLLRIDRPRAHAAGRGPQTSN